MARTLRCAALAWISGALLAGVLGPAAGAATPTVREFSEGITPSSGLNEVTAGPDGNLWFTETGGSRIGRISPAGTVTEISDSILEGRGLIGIAAGPDGNLWASSRQSSEILRITPAGTVSSFPSTAASTTAIAAGPDGNLWFADSSSSAVGRITTSGNATSFTAGITPASLLQAIAAGPDGNVWFAESDGNQIGRITPDGTATEFSAGISPGSAPNAITAGPDGNLWFTERTGNRIGRITPEGVVTEFSAGVSPGSFPSGIAAGPDGNLWFSEFNGDRIARITPAGVVTEFGDGISANSGPGGITAGPDGNLWFAEFNGDRMGRITTAVDPPRFTVAAPIALPASGTRGRAEPYPAVIEASGLQGTVTKVTVRLNGLHHSSAGDVEALLVGPQGQAALLLADHIGVRDVATGQVLTFDDAAPASPPRLVSGIFKPFAGTGFSTAFEAPAPATAAPSLAVFNGTNPNGQWKLFAFDDTDGDAGAIVGGWSLDIQTSQPSPGDTTRPSVRLGRFSNRVTQRSFRRGVRVQVIPSEPVTVVLTLAANTRRSRNVRSFPLALKETTARVTGTRTFRIRPNLRLLGRPRRTFKARLRVRATDAAGNTATTTRTITVRRR